MAEYVSTYPAMTFLASFISREVNAHTFMCYYSMEGLSGGFYYYKRSFFKCPVLIANS